MSRMPKVAAAIGILLVATAATTCIAADKSLVPRAGYPPNYEDDEGYVARARPEGIQIFVGTPHSYNGYRPYYGPYMYGSPTRSASGGKYVGVGNGHGADAGCRRWAWVHLPPGKWLWGIIDTPNGEWRCAEW